MQIRLNDVTRHWSCAAGVLALRRGDLALLADDDAPRWLGRAVTAVALRSDGCEVAFGMGDEGAVRAVDFDGAREWPPLGARVTCIAIDAAGRVVAGTLDDRVVVGDPGGAWQTAVTLDAVHPDSQDVFAPGVRAVGVLRDGAVVAVSGNGRVRRIGPSGAAEPLEDQEQLAYEEGVEIAALDGGFLAASERLVLSVTAKGERRAMHAGLRGISADLRAFLDASGLVTLSDDGVRRRVRVAPEGARCVARDGDALWVGCADGTLHLLAAKKRRGPAYDLAPCAIVAVRVADGVASTLDARDTLRLTSLDALDEAAAPRAVTPPRRTLRVAAPAYAAAWAHDGETFGVRGKSFTVYDARDGSERARWSAGEAMELWYADGAWVAYSRSKIDVYDGVTLARRGGAPVAKENLSRVATSPAGLLLKSSAGLVLVDPRGAVRAIDTGARTRKGLLHHWLSTAVVSPDGARVVASPVDHDGLLISLPDGARLASLPSQHGAWQFSPDGARLLEGRSGAIFTRDGAPAGTCGGGGDGAAAWSPDGATIARIEGGAAWLADADGGARRALDGARGGNPMFSPDGARLLLARDGDVSLFDMQGGARIATLDTRRSMQVRFVSPTRWLMWPNTTDPVDPTLWLADARGGSLVAHLRVPVDESFHWCSPLVAGDRVIVASRSQSPWAFSLDDGAPLGRIDLGPRPALRTLAASASGDVLALTEDGAVTLV